jgi:dienelactone hydrolase
MTSTTFQSMSLSAVERPGSFSSVAIPSVPISSYLYRPHGNRRAPAVILLHGGRGIHHYSHAWATWLAMEGYVALVVDSLTSRAAGRTSIWEGGYGVSLNDMAADAYGGLAYLGTQPFVDAERVALMGWSAGGAAAFTAVNPTGRHVSERPTGPGFRAVIGVYPVCDPVLPDIRIPVLLILGEEDFVTSRCAAEAGRLRAEQRSVMVKIYPGAKHGFDQEPWVAQYDATATADARAQVRVFLREHLVLHRP